MKVQIEKEAFLNALLTAEKMSGKQMALPVLNSVLLKTEGEKLILRATNLEIGIELSVPATVIEEGTVALPGAIVANVVATVDASTKLTLETVDSTLAIVSQRGKTAIKLLDPEEFPTLPQVTEGEAVSLSASLLVQGIRAVSYSASISTIKPELGSVYVYPKENTLIFVATDSFRLAEKIVTLPKPFTIEPFLLPIRNVADCIRVLEQAQGAVELRASEHQAGFSFDTVYLTSRLVEGSFPDYRQIIPKESVCEVTVLKDDMLQALRKASIFSDKFNQITFHIEPQDQSFKIHAFNADIGETTDTIPGTVEGEELHISFNQKYIVDCFQSIASDSIVFALAGPGRPMIMRGLSDPSFFYLVMPMNK